MGGGKGKSYGFPFLTSKDFGRLYDQTTAQIMNNCTELRSHLTVYLTAKVYKLNLTFNYFHSIFSSTALPDIIFRLRIMLICRESITITYNGDVTVSFADFTRFHQ